MKTIIYTLSDGLSIRYIGKTINPKLRYKSHISESKKLRTHKEKWITNVLTNGGKIIMEVLDICDEEDSNQMETYWISQFKSWGFNLVNLTSGGDGGSPMLGKFHSHETKSKMSKIAKTQKRNIGGWNKGMNMSTELKEKLSKVCVGRRLSSETKQKISENTKGKKKKPMSQETKLKISEKKKGLMSPNKGNKYNEKQKKRMSLSKLGVKRTDVVKKTLSECKKMVWTIKSPNGDFMDFFGYDSFKEYVSNNSLNVSTTTLKSYGKNKGWVVISKKKQ